MLHTTNCSCCVQEDKGERSKEYGISLGNLGNVLEKKGDYIRALPMLQQACVIFEVACDCPKVVLC